MRDFTNFETNGDISLPCWSANAYNMPEAHKDCVGFTYNASDATEFLCACECHKTPNEESDAG